MEFLDIENYILDKDYVKRPEEISQIKMFNRTYKK